ncbi:ParB/RepB/Spo0J family partition protein [Noviherbaspirillum saxi]|uniref:ParB/RepB/Spo0J family partition protein n=1 Tax=Noviherbaspirillum saxi TaxID=2320863 RepID=A0A3A3FFI2_9BURK|nr:ParB/RepB/Spo0J family partition protein [Noviherbaspirillum saxi]RJF92091.1 ParB/RepB/Spo0J family partition protein [Noviherbaspirillum saxi]
MSIYDKLGAKTAGIKARTVDKPTEKTPRTAPGMFLNAAQRIDAAETKVEELEARLKEAEAAAVGRELSLDALHEVAGRRRKLTEQQYNELKENLRQNPLVTPVTVRKREEGGFEIVSGNNRVAVFRELGRTHIPAVLLESDDDQAEINAFYANLIQPDLPPFEKYLGFKKILSKHPQLTHTQIASAAGVSRSFVSQLMAFDELPEEAIAILLEKPGAIGANAAQDLAVLAKKGKSEKVIEAIAKAASGELDQAQAVRYAALDSAVKRMVIKSEPVRIRSGKTTYCDLRRANNVLRLQFQSAEEASAAQEMIQDVLEKLAAENRVG